MNSSKLRQPVTHNTQTQYQPAHSPMQMPASAPLGYGCQQLPAGMHTGNAYQQLPIGTPSDYAYQQLPMPMSSSVMPTSISQPVPQTLASQNYVPGFLKTQIGRKVKVEFLIGTNMFVDREGTLVSVGVSFIIIQETATDDYLLCDMYSIKFIKFYY